MSKTLYTAKIIAKYLDLTPRRVNQMKAEGVIQEAASGLFDLQRTVRDYIRYCKGGTGEVNLNEEKAKLTRAKRERAEMENRKQRGELHEAAEIKAAITAEHMNMRTRLLALPAKLSPSLASMQGDQAAIFDALKAALDEVLEQLSDYEVLFAVREGEDEKEKAETEEAGESVCGLPVVDTAE